MKEHKFKVGERYTSKLFVDKGEVIEITEISGGTVFYKDVVGESICLKYFQIGSIFSAALEKVDTTIVIYRKDNKVIALDKSTGEKAEANCNPADKFDFRTGAKLAFNRLMGEDAKPCLIPYKNGDIFKVNCVTTSGCFCKKSEENVGLWHKEYVVLENYKPEEKSQEDDDSEIRVGDMVEVTRSGGCYSTYDTWSGLGSYRQNFVNGVSVEDGMVAKVLNIAKHDRLHNFRLALIQNPKTTQVFIIKIDGIKKVER